VSVVVVAAASKDEVVVDSQESISLPGQCAPTSRPRVLKALQLAVRANARARQLPPAALASPQLTQSHPPIRIDNENGNFAASLFSKSLF